MKCINPKIVWPQRSVEWCDTHEEYPIKAECGKCMACLMNRRVEWSFRLEQEDKYSKSAVFVTLTYDPKHYPSDGNVNKRDVQLYLKRLRKLMAGSGASGLRYYVVGEYGSKFGRAHYHGLLFNVDEKLVRQAWCDSKGKSIGYVHVGSVSGASVGYVLKYMVQPEQDDGTREKPFALMSRGYGIGGRYLSDVMVAWHREDDRNYAVRDGKKVRLPRFYRTKIWYKENEKEKVSRKSLTESLEASVKEENYFRSNYGLQWRERMEEFRDAVLSRVKQKVAFSQTF